MRKAQQMKDGRWLGASILSLLVVLLLMFLRMRAIIPDSWLVYGLILILDTASFVCGTLFIVRISRSKS